MGLGTFLDDLSGGLGTAMGLQDQVIRLGVTGLSRAGKTVFITSLVANLMDRGRMAQLTAAQDGTIRAAWLQPQPDDTIPRFDFESHLASLTASEPHWPEGTRRVSQLRLSLRINPKGLFAFTGPRTLHLDIIDYPGEWLMDLSLLEMDYATWSEGVLARLPQRPGGADYLAALAGVEPAAPFDEVKVQALSRAWTAQLQAAKAAGFSDCSPGRFLLPGEMEGSPVLTFAPLPAVPDAPRRSMWRECERRFEAYKTRVVQPFFRDHFSKIDRQVVLVDVLGAIHAGPAALEDLRRSVAGILSAFRPGQNAWLTRLFGGRRVEKILFAATKADHLHHSQHPRLTAITEALLREARDRADFAGAETAALSIAALRTTVEDRMVHDGAELDVVRGRLASTGRQAALYPGELPADPRELLSPARDGAQAWLDGDYGIMDFAPATLTLRGGEGPPHIRLDRAAEFLIGDKLQ